MCAYTEYVVGDYIGDHPEFKVTDRKDMSSLYEQVMERAIFNSTSGIEAPYDVALSGGFDSNCILYYLKNLYPDTPVRAYSIGGVKGADETGVATQIASMYSDVIFKKSFVSPETLKSLDEIVE